MLHKTFVALLAVASIDLVSPTMALARGGGGGAKTVPGDLRRELKRNVGRTVSVPRAVLGGACATPSPRASLRLPLNFSRQA